MESVKGLFENPFSFFFLSIFSHEMFPLWQLLLLLQNEEIAFGFKHHALMTF